MTFAKQRYKSTRILQWIGVLSVSFACTCPIRAQSNWPETFTGLPDMGPYAWVDGPSEVAKNPGLSSAVLGGQEGSLKLYVCRAQLQDGVHTGKYFNGQCNIGWGGQELSLTTGYQLLVNTQPNLANFLPQTWVAPATSSATTFHGGTVGNTQMRVCRASHNNGFHPGKEWAGKCYIGWGGQEIAGTSYDVLSLGFNKSSWMNTSTIVVQPTPTDPTVTVTMPNLTAPLNLNIQQPPPSAPVVVTTLQRLTNVCLISYDQAKSMFMVPKLNYTDQSGTTRSPKSFQRTEIAAKAQAGSGLEFRVADSTSATTWFVKEDVPGKPGWFRLRFLTTNLYVEVASIGEGSPLILNPYKESLLQMFSVDTTGKALIVLLPTTAEGTIPDNNTLLQLTSGMYQSELKKYMLDTGSIVSSSDWPGAQMSSNRYMALCIRTYPMWVYVNDGAGRAYPE